MRRMAMALVLCGPAVLLSCAADQKAPAKATSKAPAKPATSARANASAAVHAPNDFSIELSILAPVQKIARREVDRTSSRYVLFADGSLYYAPDPIASPGRNWLPPYVRDLTPAQLDQVWATAQRLGLTDPKKADEAISFRLVPPPEDDIVYLVRFNGSNQSWNFVRRTPVSQRVDPTMSELVKALAQFAWADERTVPATTSAPKRYDFGADPYERYRGQQPKANK